MKTVFSVEDLFAQTLLEMSKTQKLSQIKVVDLIARAGTARQTFYNHFLDIDDLICYTAASLMIGREAFLFDRKSFTERLEMCVRDHRDFFTQLPDRASPRGYAESTVRWAVDAFQRRFVTPDLSPDEQVVRSERIKFFILGYSAYRMNWFKSGMKAPVAAFVEACYAALPDFIANDPAGFTFLIEDYPH